MAERRRDQFPRRLLGSRARHADRHPAIYFHGHHAATLETGRGPTVNHGATIWPGARGVGNLGRVRRRVTGRDHRYRRRHRRRHGVDFPARYDAKQVCRLAVHRNHRLVGDAGTDHPAVHRAYYSRRPIGQRRRSGELSAQRPL